MKRRFALAGCATLCVLSAPAWGVTIDNLRTPTLIELPNDGNLYGFRFVIDITPGIGEAAGGFFPVVFQDTVFNTQFDWANLNVPANEVGTRLTYVPTLQIGCTNSITPNVFGPLGSLNNAAATATYFFPTRNSSLGAVKIECNLVDPNAPGPPFVPTASGSKDYGPIYPYSPGDNNLLPQNYLNAGSGLTATNPVPEPGTAWLLASGLGMCTSAIVRRRSKSRST